MYYKWKNPKDNCEKIELLTLIEDRGDRVLVESNFTECFGAVIPTYCIAKNELVEA